MTRIGPGNAASVATQEMHSEQVGGQLSVLRFRCGPLAEMSGIQPRALAIVVYRPALDALIGAEKTRAPRQSPRCATLRSLGLHSAPQVN